MPPLTLDWLHLIALLGAGQGLVLTGVLATRHRNPTANRLLAVAVFAFSIHMLSVVYYAANLVGTYPHFFGVAYPLPLLYGPLVYLYAVTASDRSRRLTTRDWLHFLPFLAVVVAGVPIFALSGPEKVEFFERLQRGDAPMIVRVADPLKLLSGLVYSGLTIAFLSRHQLRVMHSYSSLEHVNLAWLRKLAYAAAAIWVLAALPLATRGDDLVAVALAVLVYGIGYKALRQPEVFNYAPASTLEHPIPQVTASHRIPSPAPAPAAAPPAPEPPPPSSPSPPPPPVEEAAPRYERSGLAEREARMLKEALRQAMETERPWQESELTLDDLARRLSTSPHKLSEVLSTQLEQTFYDFVNGYRVRDVQRRIAEDRVGRLRLLSLALDAGFASKSTFNFAFKKHTGLTPSEYRQSLNQ